jgi:hypothetical protein
MWRSSIVSASRDSSGLRSGGRLYRPSFQETANCVLGVGSSFRGGSSAPDSARAPQAGRSPSRAVERPVAVAQEAARRAPHPAGRRLSELSDSLGQQAHQLEMRSHRAGWAGRRPHQPSLQLTTIPRNERASHVGYAAGRARMRARQATARSWAACRPHKLLVGEPAECSPLPHRPRPNGTLPIRRSRPHQPSCQGRSQSRAPRRAESGLTTK